MGCVDEATAVKAGQLLQSPCPRSFALEIVRRPGQFVHPVLVLARTRAPVASDCKSLFSWSCRQGLPGVPTPHTRCAYTTRAHSRPVLTHVFLWCTSSDQLVLPRVTVEIDTILTGKSAPKDERVHPTLGALLVISFLLPMLPHSFARPHTPTAW